MALSGIGAMQHNEPSGGLEGSRGALMWNNFSLVYSGGMCVVSLDMFENAVVPTGALKNTPGSMR